MISPKLLPHNTGTYKPTGTQRTDYQSQAAELLVWGEKGEKGEEGFLGTFTIPQ